jgi:hypothetical protein
MPLRILMFLGHLVSIGVTGDRMPGVPAILSALLGIVSEGFEDAHYFFDLDYFFDLGGDDHHHHGHEHSDLPNQVLSLLFSPIFALAASWHYWFQAKPATNSWVDCYHLMQGHHLDCHGHHAKEELLSSNWYQEEAMMQVEKKLQASPTWLEKIGLEEVKTRLESLPKSPSSQNFGLFKQPEFKKIGELCQKAFESSQVTLGH